MGKAKKCPRGHVMGKNGYVTLKFSDGVRREEQIYKCRICMQQYIFTASLAPGKKMVTTKGDSIINLGVTTKLVAPVNQIKSVKEKRQFEGYSSGNGNEGYSYNYDGKPIDSIITRIMEARPRICPACSCKLLPLKYYVKKDSGKVSQLNGTKCPICGRNYFEFYLYNSYRNAFNPTNLSHISADLEHANQTMKKNNLDVKKISPVKSISISEKQENDSLNKSLSSMTAEQELFASEVKSEQTPEFKGYTSKILNGKIVYSTNSTAPIPAYVCNTDIMTCDCGTGLYDLQYTYSDSTRNGLIAGKKCPSCGKNYFVDLNVEGKEKFIDIIAKKIEFTQAPIVEEKEKVEPEQIRKENGNEISCYIYDVTPTNKCPSCNGLLRNENVLVRRTDGKEKTLVTRKCQKCGRVYLNYGVYENFIRHATIHCINSSEVPEIKKSYEQRVAKKREQKRLREYEKSKKAIPSLNGTNTNHRVSIGSTYSSHLSDTNHYYNYCMCELMDTKTMISFKVTVNNASSSDVRDMRNRMYPVGTEFGDECLKAAANDLKTIVVKGSTYRVIRHVRYDAAYVDSYIDQSITKKPQNVQYTTGAKTAKQSTYKHYGSVDAKSDVKDVYVYGKLQSCGCIKNNHKVGTVTMKAHSLTSTKEVNINAYHCFDCRKYFVNNDAMKDLLMKRTFPLVKFHIVGDFSGSLNPESELKMYGYTVQEGVLSEKQRQNLLASIIDKKLMTKQAIINCIRFNLDFVGKKANMERANEKWRNDIAFVSQYVKGNTREIKGKLVR